MRLLSQLRDWAGTIPRASVRREAQKFIAATKDCRKAQQSVLARLLELNAGSRFSRDHHITGAGSGPQFAELVPISGYEYFRPYIDDLKVGRCDALLGPSNRLLMFSMSSGTTSSSKYIPITERFLKDYRRGWETWGIFTLDAHPSINSRNILQISSAFDRFRTAGGTPCGNISGLVAAMQKRIVRSMYTVPRVISEIGDSDAKTYTAVRLAVADANVAMVTTANPSTILQLAKLADREKETLIRDIADGTLSSRYEVATSIRAQLGLRKNRRRARDLERIVESTGQLQPKDYWRDLAVLAIWTAGSAGSYLPAVRQVFGDAVFRDHGLSASEGRMTIPLQDNVSDGILDVNTHYFEFIPEEEYESRQRVVLKAHELEPDRNYYILLTTSSGLYRYDICDVVRCVGFAGTTPLLRFLHKGSHIANLTGEKLSESQVVAAVRDSVERLGVHVECFTIAPVWDELPHYRFLCEQTSLISGPQFEQLVGEIDANLKRLNCEYREKRSSGRLGPVKWLPLPKGAWFRFMKAKLSRAGASIDQYKHPCLVANPDFCTRIVELCAAQENASTNDAAFTTTIERPAKVTQPTA